MVLIIRAAKILGVLFLEWRVPGIRWSRQNRLIAGCGWTVRRGSYALVCSMQVMQDQISSRFWPEQSEVGRESS